MKNKGFTTIELLVTIAILGIIVVMVATISPSIIQRTKLNGVVNELLSDLNMAKQIASSENRYVMIDFSDDGSFYTLRKQHDPMVFDISDVEDENIWQTIKKVRPLDDAKFFETGGVTDFALSSTGQTRLLDEFNPDPAQITLEICVKKRQVSGDVDYIKKIIVYPYGGIKLE